MSHVRAVRDIFVEKVILRQRTFHYHHATFYLRLCGLADTWSYCVTQNNSLNRTQGKIILATSSSSIYANISYRHHAPIIDSSALVLAAILLPEVSWYFGLLH